jgi:hypothetical protein
MIYADKIKFALVLEEKRTHYVGRNCSSKPTLDSILTGAAGKDVFLLYFNNGFLRNLKTGDETYDLFLEILDRHPGNKVMVAVDCDALGQSLEKVYVSHHRKIMAPNYLMWRKEEAMDCSISEKPLNRRPVKIPCPSLSCDQSMPFTWACRSFRSVVEYRHIDDVLYCDCGAASFESWQFRCNSETHGLGWAEYQSKWLLQLLKCL